MRVNEKIITDFLKLQEQLPKVIELYGLHHNYIYTKAGISKSSYFRKLKAGTFDGAELLRIAKVINR